MKAINDFVAHFNASITLDKSRVVKNRNRYYLLPKKLKQLAPKGYFYAGAYLGAEKGLSFFPSFLLLSMIAENKANMLVVDKKTAWLFICGRDLFKQGILTENNLKKGDYALIMNERNECLGFGKLVLNFRDEADVKKVAVKNVLDLGDFLRREKHQPRRQHESGRMQGNNRTPQKQYRK